ncbi:2-hydroxyacid dehydrogenase [Pseudohalocynthiibacter aestuariivivens]|jgi:lactate dehydrogenase-like 2-hydroxyacid dehydrogenase|uniref:2-hydroxyacid dehydrogenase n=1 Tax=Pseudohalocynthiibacter aestuariivivens TaxID=1591409 RepID=A0ABV5JKG6_9RHOB|nr:MULTISPECIES: D-glycerate dehydrogenase [Pseudohalocynthiibacter]MBS9716615.1 D-glycerate dehydrogenase [Pseudohalocynthiibacter aestuariivivens]MCK0101697.1 D-glycerate dehydrogenase [Pseudohalocynthiibacter sp. F2068]
MTKPVVWISRRLSDATLERAARDYDVIVNTDDTLSSADDIVGMSAKVDAIIPCHSELFSAEVAARLDPRLKIIANHSVGVDHCDLPALKARGITITNTPDVLSDATAEIAMLLMLGAARHAVEGDDLVRSGNWDFWSPSFMVGKQTTGARLGIIGMGRVGQAFARKALGFDMEIHYYNRSRLSEDKEQGAIFHETIEGLLSVADFLSLHCPATSETTGLMNADRFALLPDGAVVVNTARGALVDEVALLEALKSGKLSAVGLDCFAVEPGGNPAFAAYKNIFMLPHIGSATTRTRDAMGFRALDNLDAFFAGKTPKDQL